MKIVQFCILCLIQALEYKFQKELLALGNDQKVESIRCVGRAFTSINVPILLAKFGHINSLEISFTSLEEIPDGLEKLKNLSVFMFMANDKATDCSNAFKCKDLNLLKISRNRLLENFPSSIAISDKLQILDLSGNKIQKFPHFLVNGGENLKYLNLNDNLISELPSLIGNLKSLKNLLLRNNRLKKICFSIENLENLLSLDLHGNCLRELPNSIVNLPKLGMLDLSKNYLTKLPNSIGNLSGLNHLDLSHNQLTELPSSIGDLVNLFSLSLSFNNIVSMPISILNLKLSLKSLELISNPIQKIGDTDHIGESDLIRHFKENVVFGNLCNSKIIAIEEFQDKI